MNDVLASVIILNYNGAKYLNDCIASVLDQEMAAGDYEVIVVDNASTDGSADAALEAFPSIRLVRLNQNYGFCEGNNQAAEHAAGKYLVFLNMDTIVHRRWLPELIRAAESDPAIKACQSNMLMPWTEEFGGFEREAYPKRVYFYDVTRYGYAAYHSIPFTEQPIPTLFLEGGSFLIDRCIVEQFDSQVFDPVFGAYAEDLDLALRINGLGFRTVTAPASVVYHLHSFAMQARAERSSIRKAAQIVRNRILAYYRNLPTQEFLLLLPFLVLGAPLKVRELGWSMPKQVAYGLGAVPVTLIGLVQAAGMVKNVKRQRAEQSLLWVILAKPSRMTQAVRQRLL